MEISKTHYKALVAIICFYLFAQIFQQYILRFGPVSFSSDAAQTLLNEQHPLNITRLFLILLSIFLILIGYLILTCHFYKMSPILTITAFTFFAFFCLFEAAYRSVELFQVVLVWGKEFAEAPVEMRSSLLPKFESFSELVSAIYFPLLFSHLLGSVFLMIASLKDNTAKLITLAMAINSLRLALRLTGFTPFENLNIFSGSWYFPPVAVVLILLLIWAWKKAFHKSIA